MKIDTLHTTIFNLVGTEVTGFAQGFYEFPKEITDEKVPAYAVYYSGHDNEITTSASNKRTYYFTIDVIYDKETMSDTQTITSDLVSEVITALEDKDNYSLGGNADYTLPTTCERIQDLEIAGKHYLAYRITLPVICNESV